ncbi:DUF2339 domain-containing protein [Sandaracinus amylolyticus]|uniref:DUF2339 domain-containing protein n=1 Tax=Sandaracinus amylolyticus TaxID=927083 RepID=UPI001F3780B2|nr:DUF2339 domain-containing protein [Sandaracinus amylolyticus]
MSRWDGAAVVMTPRVETVVEQSETAAESETEAETEPVAPAPAAETTESDVAPPSGASPPAPPPPAPPPPPPPPAPSDSTGAWERWIGVRGAAAAGAIVLVIAGLSLFQYSIEHGWITPALRVALGGLVGLACVVASEWPLRTRFPALSGWIAGAGVAILYLASWAASALYELVPLGISGALMVAVTVACVVLSARRSSLPIALLGLSGGFLTPLALSTGADRPIPLFAYLLVLDAGLLVLAYRKRWPGLALLSFVATALYQLLWVFASMGDATVLVGVAIVVAFAALFVLAPAPRREGDATSDGWTVLLRAGAVLHPFLLVLAFARLSSAPLALGATAALLVVLAIGSAFVARRDGLPWIALFASAAAVGVWSVGMLSWPLASIGDASAPLAIALVIALVFHVSAELDRGARFELGAASSLASTAPLATIAMVAFSRDPAWVPLAVAALVLLALALRASCLPGRAALALPAAVLAPIATYALAHAARDAASPALVAALIPLQAVPFQIAASLATPTSRRALDAAAAVAALFGGMMLALAPGVPPVAGLGASLVCALLALFAASREGGAWIAVAAIVVTALVQARFALPGAPAEIDAQRLALLAGSTLVLAAWPSLAPRLARTEWGWRAAALVAPLSFLSLRHLWLAVLGDRFVGALAILCALLSLAVAQIARSRSLDGAVRRVALVWPIAVAAGFVTLAIPLQLDREWWTIGWALEAAALLVLDRRFDHAGVRYLAMALFAAVTVRLVLNPDVLVYYPRGELRIVNWLSYTYLVPALALFVGSRALADLEVARRRAWERGLYPEGALLAPTLFAAGLVVVFVWLNLTIIDWFATGPALTIPMERMPARDLAMSISWAVYALVLLALGMARGSTGLRATSLGLLVITCAKVFLYDLSHLRDLYRVAALSGLAVSLILVSLAYQRFVFRKPAPEAA